MRTELRDKVGTALGVSTSARNQLDCAESDHLFVVFMPGSSLSRDHMSEDSLQPLLRQAIVATSAAVETYIADRVMELAGAALRARPRPTRLDEFTLTFGDWFSISEKYPKRKGWGIRRVLEEHVRREASPAASQVGVVFAVVGQEKVLSRVDTARKVGEGTSARELDRLYRRRNLIAHASDRSGRSRAEIKRADVEAMLTSAEEIVAALDKVVR
ncbi:MAG TPA: HEPN domain-containing protein [Actinomycetota bacterium]|jgi:hypothetical protein